MDSSSVSAHLELSALLTSRLILLPIPTAVSPTTSPTLAIAVLHSDWVFCEMAFGGHFPARNRSDDEKCRVIETRH
ncbi:uncharacterized protein BJX67DRAFT_149165 [Aspergillus lucknowensis]|uniref:Secreted protein n=1 Tax=Aspergillus lucknowensis TaxID=176173 RepID=A0ABR4LN03_9EURO